MRRFIPTALPFALCVVNALAATLNPSASKAYVDKKFADLRAELRENGVFTNTLQEIVNVYSNTYTDVTFKTNVTVDVQNVTTNFYYNTYTNNFQTNNYYTVYNVTTNYIHRDYSTNFTYYVTVKTNVTVDVVTTTNVYTDVYVTTNVNEYITNTVNVVTNDIVFTGTVWYTNDVYWIPGYTGVIIRATAYDGDGIPIAFATNAISFFGSRDIANNYTNDAYTLSLLNENFDLDVDKSFAMFDRNVHESMYSPVNAWDELGLVTTYEGKSPETAESMTLILSTNGMDRTYALILERTGLETEYRNTRHVNYNPTMAAGFSDEARRLASDGGLQWLDPTGVWWEVSSEYPVRAYRLFGLTLMEADPDTGYDPDEDARFTNGTCVLRHSLTAMGSGYYSTWEADIPVAPWTLRDTQYVQEYDGLPETVWFYDQGWGTDYYAYSCTAITNGVSRTNAVRKVVFNDDVIHADSLSKFDDASISTNLNGALEIFGFSDAGYGTIPVKSTHITGVEWVDASQIASEIAESAAKNATWGYYGGTLYNCYVQVGRTVYAAGTGGSSSISASGLLDGAYCVGVTYNGSGYTVAFGRVDAMSGNPLYDAIVFVGSFTTVSGTKTWSGVGSIPIIMVFE